MKKVFKTLSAVFAAAMILSLAACSGDTETEYVDRLVEVPVEATSADVTKVVHMRQNLECTGYSKWQELSENHTAGTKLEALKQDYTGFTPIGLCQTGSTVYVFYDRNTVTVTYDYDGGTSTTTENAASKVYKVVYGTTGCTAPLKPVKDGYHFNYWTVDGTETTPSTTAEQDVVYKANYHAVQNFTVSYVSSQGNSSFEIPCHTLLSSKPLADVTEGENVIYFRGWYSDQEFKNKYEGYVTAAITVYAKFSDVEVPEGFVEVKGTTVTGASKYAAWSQGTLAGAFINGRNVTLSDYYIGITEVTKSLYKSVMEDETYNTYKLASNPSITSWQTAVYVLAEGEEKDELPVDSVNWYDAVYFCNVYSAKKGLDPVYTLSDVTTAKDALGLMHITSATVTIDLTKKGYRLPTEAEWEYAARGGHKTYGTDVFAYQYAGVKSNYSGSGYPSTTSDDAPLSIAWCSANVYNVIASNSPGYGTHQVGLKTPNALGLYDMTGNVGEWTNDRATWRTLTTGAVTDPCENDEGTVDNLWVPVKGGAWDSSPTYLCVGGRESRYKMNTSAVNRGIRLVRTK